MTRQAAADREADALDAALSDILWGAQLDPEQTPRIVFSALVNRGHSYLFPGRMFPDGRARIVVNKLTPLNVPAILRQLATQDEPNPGAEPPAIGEGAA